ncbi:MAG: hypothetical protein PHV74_15845 [Dehalococcoidia bacterium]|nr:hypothetical protein [Dehalococcoidia bacterium]
MNKGVWEEVVDLQPMARLKEPMGHGLPGFETSVVQGVNMQTPQSQLGRAFKRLEQQFGEKGAARFPQYVKALGGEIELGIGAKPPTFRQLTALKAKGVRNTARDIFVKGLSKDRRIAAAAEVAPDLEKDAAKLLDLEGDLAKAEQALARETARSREIVRSAEAVMQQQQRLPIAIKQSLQVAREKLDSSKSKTAEATREYEATRYQLGSQVAGRVIVLENVIDRMGSETRSDAPETYERLLAESSYSPKPVRPEDTPSIDRSPAARDIGRGSGRPGDVESRPRGEESKEEAGADTTRPLPGKEATPHRRSDDTDDAMRGTPGDTGRDQPGRGEEADRPSRGEPPRRPLPGKPDYPDQPRRPDDRDRVDRITRLPGKPRVPDVPPKKALNGKTPQFFIKNARGVPENPGTVLFQQGSLNGKPVWVEATPPSPGATKRSETDGVKVFFKPPPDAKRPFGTPQQTLFTRGGSPAKELVVNVGAFDAVIRNGKIIRHERVGGATMMHRQGRQVVTSREERIMTPRSNKKGRKI